MIDRWSEELTTLGLAGFVAFGLPFAGVEYLRPHISVSDFGAVVTQPAQIARVLEIMALMTIVAIPLYVMPLVLARTYFRWQKLASTLIVSALLQIAALAIVFALCDGQPWWNEQLAATITAVLVCGCGAAYLAHRSLYLKLVAEKL